MSFKKSTVTTVVSTDPKAPRVTIRKAKNESFTIRLNATAARESAFLPGERVGLFAGEHENAGQLALMGDPEGEVKFEKTGGLKNGADSSCLRFIPSGDLTKMLSGVAVGKAIELPIVQKSAKRLVLTVPKK